MGQVFPLHLLHLCPPAWHKAGTGYTFWLRGTEGLGSKLGSHMLVPWLLWEQVMWEDEPQVRCFEALPIASWLGFRQVTGPPVDFPKQYLSWPLSRVTQKVHLRQEKVCWSRFLG